MPSEPSSSLGVSEPAEAGAARIRAALDSVAGRIEPYRSAVAVTADQIRGYLAEGGQADAGAAQRSALGEFAVGRVDAARLSQYLAATAPARDDGWVGPARRALEVLEQLEAEGDALFQVRVERGGDLRSLVEQALANVGRAFGAARLVDRARSGHHGDAADDALLAPFPFRRWSSAERDLAPPLVVEVGGGDLQVAPLADYLDGSQAFVLLVDGPAPPAPLARLLSPGVLVIQGEEERALERVAEVMGPAVVALLPSGAARFVHEPADGDGAGTLEVEFLPEDEPRRAIGGRSLSQQVEELRLLRALAPAAATPASGLAEFDAVTPAPPSANGATPSTPAAPAAQGDPAGTLAAWLLSRADLSNLDAVEK